MFEFLVNSEAGSPPRVRGHEKDSDSMTLSIRITPADAGTRRRDLTPMERDMNHPRGCGDKAALPATVHRYRGSPPRMRGQVVVIDPHAAEKRITPADAGTSFRTESMAVEE